VTSPYPQESPSATDERVGRVVRAALYAFGDGLVAAKWLGTPNPDLAGHVPQALAKESEEGCRAVCAMLKTLRPEKEHARRRH
jgi:uncharacterized protein (DUF2384 family)